MSALLLFLGADGPDKSRRGEVMAFWFGVPELEETLELGAAMILELELDLGSRESGFRFVFRIFSEKARFSADPEYTRISLFFTVFRREKKMKKHTT
jgi:hypothetical protein